MENQNIDLKESFEKAKLIISSCITTEHLIGVQPYLDLFKVKFNNEELSEELNQMFNNKKKDFDYE